MHKFERAHSTWWNKPLVRFEGSATTAELAILAMSCGPKEAGAWLNSRRPRTGVVRLVQATSGDAKKLITIRCDLPAGVREALTSIANVIDDEAGCPDLVIWNEEGYVTQLIEVKCPHWDRLSERQAAFLELARSRGINARVEEWEFFADV